jgi:O-antigen ligase
MTLNLPQRALPSGLFAGAGFAGVAALVGAGAVTSPATSVGLVVGMIFVVVAFRSLAAGVAMFTVITFFAQLGSGVSGVKVAGAVLVLSWLFSITNRVSRPPLLIREHPVIAWASIFFVGWAVISAAWAADPGVTISAALRLAQGVLLVFVVFSAISNRRQLGWVVGAFIAGAFVTALYGLAGGSSAETSTYADDASRLAGQIGDPNEFASTLVPALAFAAFMFASTRHALERLFLGVAVGVFALALFLTQSRGGLVAIAVVFVVTVFLAGPVRAKSIALILTVGALGVSYYTLVAPPEALQRVTHFASGGGAGRTDLWGIALRMFSDHPVNGVGAGNFQIVEPRYAQANVNLPRVDLVIDTPKVTHNTYLHVLTELGIVGFLAFAVLIVGALAAARRSIRALARVPGEFELEVLARGMLVGVIGILVAFTFISAQYEKQLWLLLGLLVALTTVARRSEPAPAVATAGDRWELGLAEEPDYDSHVSEQLVDRLEARMAERMEELLGEQQRLARRQAALAARENELRARLERAGTVEQVAPAAAPDPGLDERIAVVTSREQTIARYAAQLKERERELDRRAAELDARERALEAAPRAVAAAVVAQAPAPAVPRPTAPGGSYNLAELERAVQRHAAEYPGRLEDWESYIFFLRDYAEPDGSLAPSFDALVEDVFAEIV